MRLIHTKTYKLMEFFGKPIPFFAILSHRWDAEEVTYLDLRDGLDGRVAQMKGWYKIRGCCAEASRNGFDYAWIDSCCIDKTSSAELSEAMNSMYRWYTDAQVCYTFLSDVSQRGSSSFEHYEPRSEFRRSMWFGRGWTLQELLAPTNLVFFDVHWVEIGTKSSLAGLLSSITGVKSEHLFNCLDASIAQKMSWAASRETTREEDQAYCLMGLFQVNMPPLYGEGRQAFLRLQLEILRASDDASIFAWSDSSIKDKNGGPSLLAKSTIAFLKSGKVVPCSSRHFQSIYSMTNRGLRIETPFKLFHEFPWGNDISMGQLIKAQTACSGQSVKKYSVVVPLGCAIDGERLAVHLIQNADTEDQFHRCPGQTLVSMRELYQNINYELKRGLKTRTLYIKEYVSDVGFGFAGDKLFEEGFRSVFIKTQKLGDCGYHLIQNLLIEGDEPEWNYTHRPDLDVLRKEIIWYRVSPFEICSLLLIFLKQNERLSLQIFRHGKRTGLKIVLADHHLHQDRETIFVEHARSWQDNLDRTSMVLADGRIISASVDVFVANSEQGYLAKPGLLVDVQIAEPRRSDTSSLVEPRSERIPSMGWKIVMPCRARRLEREFKNMLRDPSTRHFRHSTQDVDRGCERR